MERSTADITIRNATPGDAAFFSDYILHAAPELGGIFGKRAVAVLEKMFAVKRNLFSYEHTLIAVADGAQAGFLLGYGYRTKAGESLRTAALAVVETRLEIFKQLGFILKYGNEGGMVNPGELFVSDIVVSPEFRGLGVARALMEAFEQKAAENRASKLALETNTGNSPAIGLYEKLGYRIEEEFSIVLNGEKSSYYRMRKDL